MPVRHGVVAIVPAKDEAERVAATVTALLSLQDVDVVVVVDGGSFDPMPPSRVASWLGEHDAQIAREVAEFQPGSVHRLVVVSSAAVLGALPEGGVHDDTAAPPEELGGTAALTAALEQHVVLLRLLGAEAEQAGQVAVRIGSENPVTGLQSTSVVSTGYGADDELVGHVGVLGPTRMNYPATISQVRAVATYLSRIIAG